MDSVRASMRASGAISQKPFDKIAPNFAHKRAKYCEDQTKIKATGTIFSFAETPIYLTQGKHILSNISKTTQ